MAIRVLAADVVDKIAAGEVLERPANLIKELVENSLDARADEIEIEFENGGRDVCVRDNGLGMAREDLALAPLRHATSKIAGAEDIYTLHSFGFRGEALASVAAVSRLTITSRQGEGPGHRVECDFGELRSPVEVACRPGTEVRVRELFANVPARLRFLKSEAAETAQIKTTLKALALANEGVSFRVRAKGELLFHWPKQADFAGRARDVLPGAELHRGELSVDGVKAEVLVSSPVQTQNVNRNLWFFVQGRWVQDRSLSAAVMESYRNLLMHGEYPTVAARLTLPPQEVDVNVHPTKAQVKFREPQAAFRAVSRAIRQVLEAAPWLGAGATSAERPLPPARDAVHLQEEKTFAFRAPEFERTQYSQKIFPLAQVREAVATYVPDPPAEAGFQWAGLQVIGQIQQTYIVAQDAQAMYLIDQHAAHERVVFERLMNGFQSGRVDVQQLLLPLVFDFSAEEVETLHANRESIERLGLSLERMGPESIAVQSVPSLVSETAVSGALQRLAYELVQTADASAFERAVGDVCASLACHSVVRAGQSLSVEQMQNLLVQMDEFPLSSFCPHGRPVFVKRRFTEIEREFGRIV